MRPLGAQLERDQDLVDEGAGALVRLGHRRRVGFGG
jgi:hypothetical protein